MSTDLDSKPSWQLPPNLSPQESLDGRPVQKDVNHIFETSYSLDAHREKIHRFLRTLSKLVEMKSVKFRQDEFIFDTFELYSRVGTLLGKLQPLYNNRGMLLVIDEELVGIELESIRIYDKPGQIEIPDHLVMPVFNSLLKVLESIFDIFPDFRIYLNNYHGFKS